LDHFNILGGSIAQIMKNTLKSNILALFRRTSTSNFLLPVKIFTPLPVILPPQILGWLSVAQFGQEFPRKVP
jgi:ABC-type molybdate transport system permease subunit